MINKKVLSLLGLFAFSAVTASADDKLAQRQQALERAGSALKFVQGMDDKQWKDYVENTVVSYRAQARVALLSGQFSNWSKLASKASVANKALSQKDVIEAGLQSAVEGRSENIVGLLIALFAGTDDGNFDRGDGIFAILATLLLFDEGQIN